MISAKVRVTFIASHLAPRLGIENALVELRDALQRRGIQSQIICLGGDERDAQVSKAIICGPPMRGLRRLDIRRARQARRQLEPGSVVVLAGLWAALPYLLANPSARDVIVWEHSLTREKINSNRSLRLLAWVARFAYRKARTVVAVSAQLGQDLKAQGLRNVVVIPNVLEAATGPVPDVPLADDRMVMIGSLTSTKNHEVALRAMAMPEAANLRLDIIGDGPLRDRLEALCARLGISDRVQFTGHLDRVDAMNRLARSSALVHTARGETFGYVYFEAAARHVPVIAVRNSIASELIDRYVPGILVGNDAHDVAIAMRSIRAKRPSDTEFARADAERDETFGEAAISSSWTKIF